MDKQATVDSVAQPPAETASFSVEEFLSKELPPKEPLVDGLLWRRDIVALAGRRRHGKTTLIGNLVVSLCQPRDSFLGYPISCSARALVLFLEDDPTELQLKLGRMLGEGNSTKGRLAILTREDFYSAGIPIDMTNLRFRTFVRGVCEAHKPDVIVFDNLAHLIEADYNNASRIHMLIRFIWELNKEFNAAAVIAAHPRKKGKDGGLFGGGTPSLVHDPHGFFEEVMGSSHFVNSCGSLWGLERDPNTDHTHFVGGAQRFTGHSNIAFLSKDDSDWFYLLSGFEENFPLAMNTNARKRAWELLPSGTFTYTDAEKAVKPALSSKSSFHEWFTNALVRLGLVIPVGDAYQRAHPGEGPKQPKS